MSRDVEIELGGKICRLKFSVAALFRLAERFGEVGTLNRIWQGILPDGGNYDIFTPEIYANTLAVAAELLKSGGSAESVRTEELGEELTMAEYVLLHAAVVQAIRTSLGRTVETESDPKKAKATPGN